MLTRGAKAAPALVVAIVVVAAIALGREGNDDNVKVASSPEQVRALTTTTTTTQPTTTLPTVTEPPATEPPVTEPPVTEAPTTEPPPVAPDQEIFGTYAGAADVHASDPSGPYWGTLTASVVDGPLAGTTMVAVYTVNRSSPDLIDPDAENTVVFSNVDGTLTGVATSYQFSPDPPCVGVGCVTTGAVLTIRITGGTGSFNDITGGEVTMTQDIEGLDNGFPEHFVQRTTGAMTGSLER
jgi:hypothetical protein